MIMPPSFGLFCQQLGAHSYADGKIEPFSQSRDVSTQFGFGALYSIETAVVRFTIGQRQLDLSSVTEGTVGLYRVLETRQDYLIAETTFDSTMRRSDGSWIASFPTDGDHEELWGACELTFIDGTKLSSIIEVSTDNSKKAKQLPFQLKPQSTFDRKDPLLTTPEKIIIVRDQELRTAVSLDFSLANPLVYGTGVLSYAGGGARYLPTADGPMLQKVNRAPWLDKAKLLVEPQASNLFTKYGLHSTCWSYTATNAPVVTENFYTMNGFSERLINWNVTGVQGLNGEFRADFEQVNWTGDTITGSSFLQISQNPDANCKCFIGLRAFETDGTTRFEEWKQVDATDMAIQWASWSRSIQHQPVVGKIQLSIKITGFNRGDTISITAGFPQLELGGNAGSRTTGTRLADTVTFAPGYVLANDYGRFTIKFAPNYSRIPGVAGHQILLDTRDQTGRNGFWVGHRYDGLFEFGMADTTGSVYIRSASVIQLDDNETYELAAWWDSTSKNMRLDLNGNRLIEKMMNTMTLPTTLPLYRFGVKYDAVHTGSFELFSFKHEMTTE